MKQINIIEKAILSEKAYKVMEKGIYTFLVNNHAKKGEIAKVVEKQFSVNVTKVNITPLYPKKKRIAKTRKFTTVYPAGKKATVWLKAGQKIEMLSPKVEKAEKKNVKKLKGEKEVEKASVEGKEGA